MTGNSPLAVSLPPERLGLAAGREWAVELKLSRRHEPLVRGEADLDAALAAAGVDPARVESVHLPPGGPQQGATGMTLQRRNLARILEFVHDGLDVVPAAHLVAHPPREFAYADLLGVLRDLLASCDRAVAVENTPGDARWHGPEDVALFAYLARREPSLDGLYAVVDSAHLPPPREGPGALAPDGDALAVLAGRLAAEGMQLPEGFEPAVADRAAAAAERATIDVAPRSEPYFPLWRTLALAGDRVRAAHLNDPEADGALDLSPHGDHAVLSAALSALRDGGGTVVLEDDALLDDPGQLEDVVAAVRALLDGP